MIINNTIKPIFRQPLNEVIKRWGKECWIENKEFCCKLLYINKGHKFSLHSHFKEETFFLFTGSIKFTYLDLTNADKITKEVKSGECIEIPSLLPHQVEAIEDTIIIEASTHHSDDGSFRYEKGDSQML